MNVNTKVQENYAHIIDLKTVSCKRDHSLFRWKRLSEKSLVSKPHCFVVIDQCEFFENNLFNLLR